MNLDNLAKINSSILITGETGTGKTSLAKDIHELSNRKHLSFVSVNLAGLSDELFSSELFGHKKGSFTGAIENKRGFCDGVEGGTLFLDEIGDLTPVQQKLLLKLIDEKRYRPVGELAERAFSGSIIMATHKNLELMVEEGTFRQDLYFRIRVFSVELEPLRESPYKLQIAIENNLKVLITRNSKSKDMAKETVDILLNYTWPGNYRELKNTMEYLYHHSEDGRITNESLPIWVKSANQELDNSGFHAVTNKFEKEYLIKQLITYNGRINETALKTGLNKVTLISKIKKYAIDLEYIKIISKSIIALRSAS